MLTDHQLDRAARRLTARGDNRRISRAEFFSVAPTIAAQIETDADSRLLQWWGLSRNLDENARQPIVPENILGVIGDIAQTKIRRSAGWHAGLMHAYGYLLSLLLTPYGYKRDRWLTPTIENGLRIRRRCLRAEPYAGTLLGNLTYYLARIVHRHDRARLRQLEADSHASVAPYMRRYDFRRLRSTRICERVSHRGKEVELVTDLTAFFPSRKDQQRIKSLLTYSIRRSELQLVTCFVVGAGVVEQLCDPSRLRGPQQVRLKYNAHVPGFPQDGLTGRRVMRRS